MQSNSKLFIYQKRGAAVSRKGAKTNLKALRKINYTLKYIRERVLRSTKSHEAILRVFYLGFISCGFVDRFSVLTRFTKTPAARRFDPHAIARRQIPTAFRRKLLLTSISADDERAPECSIIPALQSIRGALAAI